ncbi:MAG: indolepyruvate ferredoxin oxidoreductase subunit alpha [Desulfobacterales bacterium]|nr:indolepyruvate ferredoxin oxidoreductase subunit alpha [Desulfobacterales bacterium]
MKPIVLNQPDTSYLVIGNEAIARGAIEAGVDFCAAYPGNPSSEIMETLASVSKDLNFYAEWSVNEKVALEAATAASFAGLRAITSMKQNGVNVVSDFLTNLTLSGTKGGLVLVTCDDPGGISSTNEEDARPFSKLAEVPMLEPSNPQEALDMTTFAFDLSEEIGSLCIMRSTSRISHSRGNVVFSPLPERKRIPSIDPSNLRNTFPVALKHQTVIEKLETAKKIFETSKFNSYTGSENPELLIITCGTGYLYSREAINLLGLWDKIGLLKLGTTWPLPENLINVNLTKSNNILIVEEVQPFLEDNIKSIYAQNAINLGLKSFFGKSSGHIPKIGELNPDILLNAISKILNIKYQFQDKEYSDKAKNTASNLTPPRELGFCPGCPHRASFFNIKNALKFDARNGFVSGDIGCYTMAIWPTGFKQVNSVHAMGSGVGLASGYGKLHELGFNQPIISVVGDSTFFHAGLPPLINAVYNKSNFLLIVLDNSATAMTGFQPHPGTGINAKGEPTNKINIEDVCNAVGAKVEIVDPFDIDNASKSIYRLLQNENGVRVIIMRRKCALVQRKEGGFPYKVEIDSDKCIGEECGCNRYCTRVFRCPGLIWDKVSGKTKIDTVICVGCGVCAKICPKNAIILKEVKRND